MLIHQKERPGRYLVQICLLHCEQPGAIVKTKPCRVPGHNSDVIPEPEQDQPAQRCQVLLVQQVLLGPVIVNVCQEDVVLQVQVNLIRVLHT